ncbi:hypothetical protein E8E13_001726 [Curvularia kusanoi]|uniref:Heterokaryon incompatibility domain-containing protein n=1 Tax=Curvularia kusanoi TaxID=90978 RepID=A0A9P4W9W6_CURKU|nr:hypothetical protein E8E13_001726 [Curvularia kusanoi]
MEELNLVLTEISGGRPYEVQAKSIEPVGVDWKAVREWIEHCTANHSSCVEPSGRAHIPGFKVIDCKTGVVGPLLDNRAPYVALSYVWGQTQGVYSDYPQTINDSMEAVLALGLRYLWVDRVCIDQEDDIHKQTQIAMMGQIYLGAYLTIVSCSDDAEQGLPGVHKLARSLRPQLWLGDRKLEPLYPPVYSIIRSRWITRGWTFQEYFFSRRKLFFTEEGVVLWCASMYYEEGVSRTLPNVDDDMQRIFVPDLLSSAMPTKALAGRTFHFADLIREYTKRDITFEHDALNACLGILNHLGFKHLWGVPVYDEPLSFGLCWRFRSGGGRERKDFPSWSWTSRRATANFDVNMKKKLIKETKM